MNILTKQYIFLIAVLRNAAHHTVQNDNILRVVEGNIATVPTLQYIQVSNDHANNGLLSRIKLWALCLLLVCTFY